MHTNSRPVCKLQNLERWSKVFEFKTNFMVFCPCVILCLSTCHGPTRGWLEKEEAGEASILEVFRVLSQSRSLNKRVVESQNMEEGSQSEFIYTRSLKFRAVEKEGRNTRSRKLKKKKKLKKLKKTY